MCSKSVGKKGPTIHGLLTPSHLFICFVLAFPPPVFKFSLWEIQRREENSLGCAALPAEAGAGDKTELLPFLTQQNEGLSWWKEAEHMNTNIFFSFFKVMSVFFFADASLFLC